MANRGRNRGKVESWSWLTKGEIEGKCLSGRRRTAWIDDVRRWTGGGLLAAGRITFDRL